MKTLLMVFMILASAFVAFGSLSIEGGPVLHSTQYGSEAWLAPGLGITTLYELSDKTSIGLTGELALLGLNDKAGLGLFELRYEAFRLTSTGLQLGIVLGLLADTVPGGSGLFGDWVPHLHFAFGAKLVALGAITDAIDFRVSATALFAGAFLSEYPSELPVVDYLSFGASIGYTF